MIERARVWSVLAAAALALAVPARAAVLRPLDVPPEPEHPLLDLHPSIGYNEVYNSNIFLLPQPVSSWIHTADLGLRVPMAFGDRQRLELNYDGSYRKYSYANTDSLKNAFIHNAYAHYWYTAPSGLSARAKDDYINTIDPATAELTQLVRRWANTAVAEVAYEPQDGGIYLSADASDLRNKYVTLGGNLAQALDRYDERVGGRVGWQVQPKTVVYAAYHRQLIHFTDNPSPSKDSKGHLVDFGTEGQFTDKLSGKAQVGLVDRLYDAPPAPGQGQRTDNFTGQAQLVYQPTERSRAQLLLDRSLQESAFDVNQFYIANALTLSLSHRFEWQLRLELSGTGELDKYPTTTQLGGVFINRRDDVYIGSASAEYPVLAWLTAGLSYSYQARFSPGFSGQFDFRDQTTTLSLTAAY